MICIILLSNIVNDQNEDNENDYITFNDIIPNLYIGRKNNNNEILM